LDEDEGILRFASLFDEAKNLSRYDFCSELLNNVQDVRLNCPYNQHWLTFYRGVMSRVHTFAWDEAYAVDQELYDQPDLPPALRARVTTDLGRYHYQIVDRYDQAIAMLNESLRLRQDLHDEQGQAHVLSHLAVAQASTGDVNGGRESGLACVRLAERLDAPYRLGWGYYSLGVVESHAGDYAAALERFHHSLAAFEAADYEFGPGVVHYQMGHVAIATGELDIALEHLQVNLQLMQKYDKPVLTARTMVDMCEVHLAQRDRDRLRTQAAVAERLLLDQANHAQLARLRLVQAEMILRQLMDRPSHPSGEQRDAQDQAGTEPALLEVVADRYLDALLSAAQASLPMLLPTVQQIEGQMERLIGQDREILVQAITQTLITGIDQALEGTLARHGQLIVLPEPVCEPLRVLDLAQRWAHP
jgi:tetratricopeptide (TPR) repeat protein